MIVCSLCDDSYWCDGGTLCDCGCHYDDALSDVEDDLNKSDEETNYDED